MSERMDTTEEGTAAKRSWQDDLRNPTRLSVLTLGGLLAFGILGVYMPLTGEIEKASKRLTQAKNRQTLAQEVEHMRNVASLYDKRVARGVDLTEWTEYLHEGVRQSGVRLLKVEPKKEVKLGPAKALGWRLETEGDFFAMARFVNWLEAGQRLVRIDELIFENNGGRLIMLVTVRGVVL